MSKEQLDIIISKFISRKLLVFAIACIGLFVGKLTSSDWVIIASTYMAVQGIVDTFSK